MRVMRACWTGRGGTLAAEAKCVVQMAMGADSRREQSNHWLGSPLVEWADSNVRRLEAEGYVR